MNRFYAHAEADEPAVRLNEGDPADPFVVIDFGSNWDFTSRDPRWCRNVAAAWAQAAPLLERAVEPGRRHVDADEAAAYALPRPPQEAR